MCQKLGACKCICGVHVVEFVPTVFSFLFCLLVDILARINPVLATRCSPRGAPLKSPCILWASAPPRFSKQWPTTCVAQTDEPGGPPLKPAATMKYAGPSNKRPLAAATFPLPPPLGCLTSRQRPARRFKSRRPQITLTASQTRAGGRWGPASMGWQLAPALGFQLPRHLGTPPPTRPIALCQSPCPSL